MLATAIEEALAAERRQSRFVLRLNNHDMAALEGRAAAAGITRAEAARALIRAGLAVEPELVAA